MGVTRSTDVASRLTAIANKRRHILIIAPAGWRALRILTEAAVVRRGWMVAQNPAEADGLITLGSLPPTARELADRLWDQLPGPRCREATNGAGDIDSALNRMAAQWLDIGAQRTDAADRGPVEAGMDTHMGHDMGTDADMDMDMDMDMDDSLHDTETMHGDSTMQDADTTHDDTTHDDPSTQMDHSMHMDHDMDMDMSGPAGIPLASGSEADRDALEMDVLNFTLGPVLPAWPDGLVVRGVLSGDVMTEVATEVIGGIADAADAAAALGERATSAMYLLDDIARVLQLSGWATLADRALRARDEIASGADPSLVEIARLSRAVRRSPVLRWSLARSGSRRLRASVDLVAILEEWMSRLTTLAESPSNADVAASRTVLRAVSADQLPELLEGLELSDVRLVVAALSLDAELAELTKSAASTEPAESADTAKTTHPKAPHA